MFVQSIPLKYTAQSVQDLISHAADDPAKFPWINRFLNKIRRPGSARVNDSFLCTARFWFGPWQERTATRATQRLSCRPRWDIELRAIRPEPGPMFESGPCNLGESPGVARYTVYGPLPLFGDVRPALTHLIRCFFLATSEKLKNWELGQRRFFPEEN